MENVDNDITIAKLRSKIYSLLARGFKEINEDHFNYLSSQYISEWHGVIEYLQGGEEFLPLLQKVQKALDVSSLDSLSDESYNLFSSTGRMLAMPCEMEYVKETPQHTMSQQAELADIAGFYRAFGLDVASTTPERVDHIATELEYIHVMALKEATALINNDAENACIVVDAQRKFINDHLGRWVDKFKERLIQNPISEFYATLGEMLVLWINIDKALLFEQTGENK
ncbi:MAG: molecular chaperone TorD family protein [Nitrospirae bacterium]|nr:molecular chaperone TorD family protein [Nitrospirota bacterium]